MDKDIRDAFLDVVYDYMKLDSRIVFITCDTVAFILKKMFDEFPERVFNIGIAEQNAISVASGLALLGKKVFILGISNFLVTRCLDQINIDLSISNLDVNLVGIGPGFGNSVDGPTHHSLNDVAIMSSIPNMQIFSMCDAISSAMSAQYACTYPGLKYFRLEKGTYNSVSVDIKLDIGIQVIKSVNNPDITIFSYGSIIRNIVEACQDISVLIVDVFRLCPINYDLLKNYILDSKKIMTIEEHFESGGLGEKIGSFMSKDKISLPFKILSVPMSHIHEYSPTKDWIYKFCGLDSIAIKYELINFKEII